MTRNILIFIAFLLIVNVACAQRYTTRNARVTLTYEAPWGTMQTENRQVNASLNLETGEFRLHILMLSFRFQNAYHQQQYNDYFREWPQFSNTYFVGHITNLDEIDFDEPGTYEVHVDGDLTIRQYTNGAEGSGDFTVADDSFSGEGAFYLSMRDFGFKIPSNLHDNIRVGMNVNLRRL